MALHEINLDVDKDRDFITRRLAIDFIGRIEANKFSTLDIITKKLAYLGLSTDKEHKPKLKQELIELYLELKDLCEDSIKMASSMLGLWRETFTADDVKALQETLDDGKDGADRCADRIEQLRR